MDSIASIVDLDRYPLGTPGSADWDELVNSCRNLLNETGMFELPGFLKTDVLQSAAAVIQQRMEHDSVEIRREHNIYFLDKVEGLSDDHPALKKIMTVNHTLCADQLHGTPLLDVYEWPNFRMFIAATMNISTLHLMDDELARVNVLGYRPGEALNWHFDRSEFTITMLLQRAEHNGIFEYRRELRTDLDPNYDAVGKLVAGNDPEVISVDIDPGALNVFRGRNTAHRVTTVNGDRERMVAVFSLYEQPGVRFSDSENLGFYRRTKAK
jgi:hypothetical protein